ncbi:hypothetical protein JCM8208_004277 [Rhodotorula glutinis]
MQHPLPLDDVAKSEPASPAASSSAQGTKGGKKSQRPSWSCTECTRRKIRCDRVVPGCNQCIKRNKVHLCRLDQDDKIGFGPDSTAGEPALNHHHPAEPSSATSQPRFASAAEFDAIQRNVTVVRQRLLHLERVVAAFVPRPDVLDAAGQPSWAVDMTALHHHGGAAASGAPDGYAPASSSLAQHEAYATQHDAYPASTHHHEPPYPSSAPTPSGSSLGPPPPPPPPQYAPGPPSSSYALPPPPPPQPQPAYDDPHAHRDPRALYSRHSSGGGTEDDGEVEAAVTLEYLALGRDGQSAHVSRAELRRPATEGEELEGGGEAGGAQRGAGDGRGAQTQGGQAVPSHVHTRQASSLDELEQPASTALGPAAPGSTSAGPPASQAQASVLPPSPTAGAILEYSLGRVGWQHGAVHAGQFLAECAEFDSWGPLRADKVNQAWLALYLAVLCVGVKHMDAADARACGLTRDDVRVLPKLWFDASVDALHRGQFLAKHSVFSVQTIVILVISCQDVGGSDLIATLLACGIRIAQHLGLSRLGPDDEWERERRRAGVEPESDEGVKGLVQREVGKRLWYALATEDWLSVPFRRSYSISPSHFTTPLPLNCHDEDLSSGTAVDRPQDEATCVSKVLVAHKVASCIRRFFDDVNVNSRPDRDLSYDLLLDVDREIRDIIETGPAFLRSDDDKALEEQPPWVRWMLHWWIMSVSHKLLMCHRVFLGRSFRDSRFAFSRKAAIEAARSIIQELVKGSHLPYQHLWTVPYHSISAAVVVILDIFQSSSADPDLVHKRREVQSVLDELRVLSDEGNSQIASRGIQLLTTLLAEEQRHRRPHKRKAAELGSSSNGAGAGGAHDRSSASASPAKRVVSISDSRTSLGAPSSHGVFAPQPHLPHPPPPQHAQAHAPPPPHSTLSPFPYFAPTLSSSAPAYPHVHGAASVSTLDATSPHSHVSADTSLTQDAFESLLSNFGGWAGGGGGGGGEAGAAFGPGIDGPYGVPGAGPHHGAHGRAGGAPGGGARGGLGPAAYGGPSGDTGEFFRMLDAGSFLGEGGDGSGYHGHHAPTPGGQASTPGQPHAIW